MTAPQLLNVDQLAIEISMSRSAIYRLMDQGLPSFKIGGVRRFRLADVLAWIDENFAEEAAS